MARYRLRWLEVPKLDYDSLPPETQRQIDAKTDLLQEDPKRHGTYDPAKAEWITDFGDGAGLILYAVEANLVTVIVLRLQAF